MYFAIGSSSENLPSSSIFTATTLLMDGLGHREQAEDCLVGNRRLRHHVLYAEGFVIDWLAVLLDQQDRSGNFPRRHFVTEELAELCQLSLLKCAPAGISKVPSAQAEGCSRD
jgi:hypothetical protein